MKKILIITFVFMFLALNVSATPQPQINITSPQNATIPNTTPDLNITTDESANITYNWDGEGNISGCRNCTSFNTTYGKNVLDDNTSALWHFNENNGSALYDDSSNNNDGNITGATWTTGRFGYALDFDGDDFVNVSDDDSLDFDTDDFTVMARIRTGSIKGMILDKLNNANDRSFHFYVSGKGKVAAMIHDTGSDFGISGTSQVNDSKWHHVAFVVNWTTFPSGTAYIYVDGSQETSKAITNVEESLVNNRPLKIGIMYPSWTPLWNFTGTIDEVHIMRRALNDSEILDYYNKTLSDGQHNVTVYANDSAGNLNSTTRWFTVDTVAPYNITLNYPSNNSNISNTSITFNWTSYDATSNMSSNLTIDGAVNQSNIDTNSGTPTLFQITGLGEGNHNWSITTWDDAGNSNTSDTYFFTVDTTPPTITITSPQNRTYSYGVGITLSFDTNETISSSLYSLDGATNVSFVNGSNSIAPSSGSHDITFYANDTANNWGSSDTMYFTVGPAPVEEEPTPSIPIPLFLKQPFTTLNSLIMNDVILHRILKYKQFYSMPMSLAATLIMLEEYPEPSLAVTLGKPIKTLEGDVYDISATKILTKYTFARTFVIARGDIAVDSTAAIAYAKSNNLPILLTKPDELPMATLNAVKTLNPNKIIVIGGNVAVSEEVEAELMDIATVERIWGLTRYETAIELANTIKDPSLIVITQGYNLTVDAVIISAAYKAPLIYVGSEDVPQSVKDYLVEHKDAKVLFVGVSEGMVKEIEGLMQG